jgi:hypothetical protein
MSVARLLDKLPNLGRASASLCDWITVSVPRLIIHEQAFPISEVDRAVAASEFRLYCEDSSGSNYDVVDVEAIAHKIVEHSIRRGPEVFELIGHR